MSLLLPLNLYPALTPSYPYVHVEINEMLYVFLSKCMERFMVLYIFIDKERTKNT